MGVQGQSSSEQGRDAFAEGLAFPGCPILLLGGRKPQCRARFLHATSTETSKSCRSDSCFFLDREAGAKGVRPRRIVKS